MTHEYGNTDEGCAYESGYKDAQKEMYEEMLATLTELQRGNIDLDYAIREVNNELCRLM